MDRIKEAIEAVINRYHTADPFVIAERLNIEVDYAVLGKMPLGKTMYDKEMPIVMLNDSLQYSPQRYFVMAHELGHVILHEGLNSYYTGITNGHDKLENEANEFGVGLIGLLYVEDNDRLPETFEEVQKEYGIY